MDQWKDIEKRTDDLVTTGNRIKEALGPQVATHYLDQRTLDKIRVMSPYIKKFAEFLDVDPTATALPMAWEYNTRFHQEPEASKLGNFAKAHGWDAYEDSKALKGEWLPHSTDIGPANVNKDTAAHLLQEYHDMINKSGILKDSTLFSKYKGQLSPWLVTDEGNAFVSALVIHDAQKKHPYMFEGLDRNDRIAHLYNMYRGGEKYARAWDTRLGKNVQPKVRSDILGGKLPIGSVPAFIRPKAGLKDIDGRVEEIDRALAP